MLTRLMAHRYVFFPPRDLNEPIFEVACKVAADVILVEAPCMHRYVGPYEVGVVCNARIPTALHTIGRVEFEAVFSNSRGVEVGSVAGQNPTMGSSWFAGPKRNGFGIARYEVPEDVKEMGALLCRVKFADIDGALAKYEPIQVYARNIFTP